MHVELFAFSAYVETNTDSNIMAQHSLTRGIFPLMTAVHLPFTAERW